MQIEDSQIISRCLNGERSAFGILVDKYKAEIYNLAYEKIGDFRESEDITQKVFLHAFRELSKLEHCDDFLGWLQAMTEDIAINKEENQ
jgi:RNA polymerase sigma-70 factor (ECF subfamily)